MLALVSLLVGGVPPVRASAASGPSLTTIETTVVALVAKGDFAAELPCPTGAVICPYNATTAHYGYG